MLPDVSKLTPEQRTWLAAWLRFRFQGSAFMRATCMLFYDCARPVFPTFLQGFTSTGRHTDYSRPRRWPVPPDVVGLVKRDCGDNAVLVGLDFTRTEARVAALIQDGSGDPYDPNAMSTYSRPTK